MSFVVDDKSAYCMPFLQRCLNVHLHAAEATAELAAPLFVGLQGIQGAGKTTLVGVLRSLCCIEMIAAFARFSEKDWTLAEER